MENLNKKQEGIDENLPNPDDINKDESSKADNNPENVVNDPAQVDALEDETMKLAKEQSDALNEAQEQTEPSADGKIGDEPKKPKRNYANAGSDTSVVTPHTLSRSVHISADTDGSFVDIDPEEKNSARIQHAIDHIAAEVIKEGTVGVTEDYINPREESDTAIERETMDSVQRAVAMAGTVKSSAAGGATQMGQFMESSNDVLDFTDHMYHTTENGPSDYSIKGMDHLNSVILNEMGPDGRPTGDFRLIPQRHVLVLGIDPIPVEATTTDDDIIVATKTVPGNYDWSTGQATTVTANVKMRKPGQHGIFKTIDVTATVEGVAATCHDLIPNVTSLLERKKLGEIEALAFALSREDLPIAADEIIPENVELHPSYKRCSLYTLDPVTMDDKRDYSCHNKIESVAKFIKFLNQSEILWLKQRLPFGTDSATIWNGYKMRKNLVGKDDSCRYFEHTLRASIDANITSGQTVPGINNYAAYINSNAFGRYNTKANFVYRFSDLKRKIEDFISQFSENKVIARSLTRAMTNLDTIEHYIDIAEFGKLPTEGSIAHFGKQAGTGVIMLNYDPNDLIKFNHGSNFNLNVDNDISLLRGTNVLKPYPCCGYITSYRVDTTKINGLDTKYYTIAPSFINAICEIFVPQNKTVISKLLNDKTRTGGSTPSVAQMFDAILQDERDVVPGTRFDIMYQPMILNTDHAEWIDFYLNELMFVTGYNAYLSGELDNQDGFDRLNTVFAKDVDGVSFKSYIEDGGISVSDAIAKIINNTQLYPNAAVRKIDDLPAASDEAVEIVSNDNVDHQIAIMANSDTTYSISAPDTRDFDLFDLNDYEVRSELRPNGVRVVTDADIADKMTILNNSRPTVGGATNANRNMALVSLGENEFIVTYIENNAGDVSNNDFAPVILRKRNFDIDDAKTMKRRHVELATGAENIEHFGEDIAKQLYGHDDHYWNDKFDGYVIKISKHYNMASGVHNEGSDNNLYLQDDLPPFEWTLSLCPVILLKTVKRSKSNLEATITADVCYDRFNSSPIIKHDGFNINGKVVTSRTGNHFFYAHNSICNLLRGFNALSLYKGRRCQTPILANYAATDKGWKFMFDYRDLSNATAIAEMEDSKVFNFSNVVLNFEAENASEVPSEVEHTSHMYEDTFRGLKQIYTEAYIPYTAYAIDDESMYYAAKNGTDNISANEYVKMTDCGDLDITKAQYWSSQYYRFDGLAGADVYDQIRDMAIYYAACNLPVCPEVLVDIDGYNWNSRGKVTDHSNNVYLYGTPGNHINTEMYPMIYESFDEFSNGKFLMRKPARWFFSCVLDGGLFDAQDVGILSTMPNNMIINPIINSRYYRRDYCDYIAFKPLVTLNRNWERKFAVNSKLADTFFNN